MVEENLNTEKVEVRSLPRIRDHAPQFEAVTTHGDLKLEDYNGNCILLFSEAADFTPVCTTEFIGYQNISSQLKEMNTELLDLSIDSISSHIVWIRNIEENFNTKNELPVISDLSMEVSEKFGMIIPN